MAKKRNYTPWEIMMISEWVARTFPDVRWQTNVRLGPAAPRNAHGQYTREELTLLGVWRRRIDAIVFLDDRLVLVEAVLRSNPGKLSILELYARLVPQTPELSEFSALPVQKVLLYVVEDPVVNMIARERDIVPVQYVPTFFPAWFDTLRPRDKRAPRSDFG